MTSCALEEVELKLELTGEAAGAFETAKLFAVEPVISRQHSVYFDTSDHALAQAGLSLRIRRVAGKWVQTVKRNAGAAAGLFIRQEWERRVKGDQPVLDGTTPIEALLAERIVELAPVFIIQNERRLWQQDGIEIALDRGLIIAGERETLVCEIELEQKAGDFATLFAHSRRIAAVAPVRLGVLSKAQRGYRLLGPLPGAAKAEPIALSCAMTAADAFEVIAHDCIVQFRLNELLVLENQEPDALHQARVALRRLRSAFSVYRAMLPDSESADLGDELRWLAGALGRARDLDVLVDRAGQGSLCERLTEARGDAYTMASHALQSKRSRILMIDLAEWLAIGGWRLQHERGIRDLPAREVASEALKRYHRKVRKGGRNLEDLDDAARHKVRKAVKKLHYAADFFATLYMRKPEIRRHKRFMQSLKGLQDQLGTLNDIANAPKLLARLGLANHPQAAALSGAKQKHRLLAAAAASVDELIGAKRFWR